MLIVAGVFAGLAAALHVLIFLMESAWWTSPKVWRRFGLKSQDAADATRAMAYNQGFYNLFLAFGVALGLLLMLIGPEVTGRALLYFSLGCMVAAAVVLTTTGRGYLRAALIQGTLPALAIILLLLA